TTPGTTTPGTTTPGTTTPGTTTPPATPDWTVAAPGDGLVHFELKGNAVFVYVDIVDPVDIDPSVEFSSIFTNQLFDMAIQVDTPGEAVGLDVILPEAVQPEFQWLSYSSYEGWENITGKVAMDTTGTMARLALTDGGSGDDDGAANGVIVTTFGPAREDIHEPAQHTTSQDVPAQSASGGGDSGGSGGGCFIGSMRAGNPWLAQILFLCLICGIPMSRVFAHTNCHNTLPRHRNMD
ncbi:MAG: choice-of-anchor U domain-containing protein, partial [Thermodesulfobacteriota bacterium]